MVTVKRVIFEWTGPFLRDHKQCNNNNMETIDAQTKQFLPPFTYTFLNHTTPTLL